MKSHSTGPEWSHVKKIDRFYRTISFNYKQAGRLVKKKQESGPVNSGISRSKTDIITYVTLIFTCPGIMM